MNHTKILLYCIAISATQTIYTDNIEETIFEQPITTIIKRRNIGEIIKNDPQNQVPPEVLQWLCTPEAQKIIHKATGEPNKKEHGFREHRIEQSTGSRIYPNKIMILNSAHKTLQETIEYLKESGYAYNFLIDTDGKIYPVTLEGESIKEALTHKFNAIRKACVVHKGSEQRFDVEQRIVSIAVIGTGKEAMSSAQEQALIKTVQWISHRYHVPKHNVKSFKCIAYPYGNYQSCGHKYAEEENILWEKLAQNNIALWPKEPDVQATVELEDMFELVRWVSGALYKVGFNIGNSTTDSENPKFKAALKMFQQHYNCDNQEGYITQETVGKLNSILLQCEEIDHELRDKVPPPLPRQQIQKQSQAFRDWTKQREEKIHNARQE